MTNCEDCDAHLDGYDFPEVCGPCNEKRLKEQCQTLSSELERTKEVLFSIYSKAICYDDFNNISISEYRQVISDIALLAKDGGVK